MTRVLLAALLTALVPMQATPAESAAPAASYCREMRTTGYVRSEFSSYTFDGTPIWTDEPIAAASWDIPIGAYVSVDGWGTYRVADRGLLGSAGWIDVAVWTRSEAFALTGIRTVCVTLPGEEG